MKAIGKIISMAHLIGMSVVTEGVETEEQKNNLISMGENYAQGFYFYRPMPVDQFEKLIADPDNVTTGYKEKAADNTRPLRFREMIRQGLVSETLLDNIIRAAAIYKVEGDTVTIIQINDLYASRLGLSEKDGDIMEMLQDAERISFMALLNRANIHTLNGSEGLIRYRRKDGTTLPLNTRVFLLYSLDNHRLYLSTIE